ncbi:MAG: serpin family protein [Hyphomonadaceae bacterium]
MLHRLLAIMSLSVVLAACSAVQAPPQAATETPVQAEPVQADSAPLAFELALYRAAASEPGNQFISPYSMQAAFGLLYPGASGAIAREMQAVFGFPASSAEAIAQQAAREAALGEAGGSELNIANAVWVERTFSLRPAYERAVRDDLGSTVETLDFAGNPDAARRRINAAVAEATRDRIPELFGRGAISADTVLALTNAVYFNGDWTQPFNEGNTSEGTFHAAGGDQTARLMRQTAHFRYIQDQSFQAADFDYDEGALALAVFLPRENSSIAAFESRLDGAQLRQWLTDLEGARTARLEVTLPRVEMNSDYDLVPIMRTMGVSAMFAPSSDLAGISAQAPLHVSAAVQKTFLAIDEEGTEAAAATGIGIVATGAPAPLPPPIVFRADRPFFIVLRHKRSGAILFMGRIAEMPPSS